MLEEVALPRLPRPPRPLAPSTPPISTDEIGGMAAVVSAGSNAYREEGGERSAMEELLLDIDILEENEVSVLIWASGLVLLLVDVFAVAVFAVSVLFPAFDWVVAFDWAVAFDSDCRDILFTVSWGMGIIQFAKAPGVKFRNNCIFLSTMGEKFCKKKNNQRSEILQG